MHGFFFHRPAKLAEHVQHQALADEPRRSLRQGEQIDSNLQPVLDLRRSIAFRVQFCFDGLKNEHYHVKDRRHEERRVMEAKQARVAENALHLLVEGLKALERYA